MKKLSTFATRQLRALLLCLPMFAFAAACDQRSDEAATLSLGQPIHNEADCAIDNLTEYGAALAAFSGSGYGHWCGGDVWGQQGGPVNCWDEACRAHDHAFHGPDPVVRGMLSCHQVLNESVSSGYIPGRVPDTDCIDAADETLCDAWTQCTSQAEAARIPANGGWRWVGAPNTMGQGRPRPIRRCNDPQAGDHRGRRRGLDVRRLSDCFGPTPEPP
jgi:hypothetical protein